MGLPKGETLETMEKPIEKLYFQIGEVADACSVVPSHIRYIEAYFKLSAHRNGRGDRRYTVAEKSRLVNIVELSHYFHLEVIRDILDQGVDLRLALQGVMQLVYGGVMRSLKKQKKEPETA